MRAKTLVLERAEVMLIELREKSKKCTPYVVDWSNNIIDCVIVSVLRPSHLDKFQIKQQFLFLKLKFIKNYFVFD